MDDILDLNRLRTFVEEANSTTSTNEKMVILARYPDLKSIFYYTYDTININYGLTSKNIKKMKEIEPFPIDKLTTIGLYDVLEKLDRREFTGHDAIRLVKTLIRTYPRHEDLIYCIIDRNLKTRTDSKLINKVWPGLIPEFNVALAETYEEKMKIDFKKVGYFASRKCDGVRLITKISKNGIEFYSRQGKPFDTLDVLKEELIEIIPKGAEIILDGELCLVDEKGNEDFQSVMEQIRRKDHIIPNPMYMVFDLLTINEFENEYSDALFRNRLVELITIIPRKFKHVQVLHQHIITDQTDFEKMRELGQNEGWEGLILRRADSPYEGKRSKNLLKVKTFIDAEYKVAGINIGPIRHIINGKEIESLMLSKVIIEHKGNEVGVGSGFSIDQRLHFKDHPEDILEKVITVTYFEETKNQDGTFSLRFPTVKVIHGDKRES